MYSPKFFDVYIGHGPGCRDGATAMWSVWRNLEEEYRKLLAKEGGFYSDSYVEMEGDAAFVHPNSVEGGIRLQQKGYPIVFVFSQPSSPIDCRLIQGKNVMIMDLDLGDALPAVVTAANSVFVCDHHDTSLNTINKYADFLLVQNRHKFSQYIDTSKTQSGATLVWKLFNSDPIPSLVDVVRIGDNWQWQDRADAKAILAFLYVKKAFNSFSKINRTYNMWTSKYKKWAKRGQLLVDHEISLVKQAAKQCDLGYIQTKDGKVFTVAYTQGNVLVSEIGASVRFFAEKRFSVPIDFCAVWKYVPHRKIVSVSLRDPRPGLKLGQIARDIKGAPGNGGGHVEAASFHFYGLDRFENYILPAAPMIN